MTGTSGSLLRFTGLVAGCAVGIALVLAGRMPEGRPAAGVKLSVSASPIAELGVSPAGLDFLKARSLVPGGPPGRGRLEVFNHTARRLTARLRLSGADRDLDRLVRVAISADNKSVFTGRLGELRNGSAVELGFAPGGARLLTFEASLPRSVRHGYQGRSAALELRLKPVEGRG